MILGTAAVHEPGAGARQAGGQARRHLGVRLRALRDADGAAGVRRARVSRTRWRASSSVSRTGPALPATLSPALRTLHQRAACRKIPDSACRPSATSGWRWRARSRRLLPQTAAPAVVAQWRRVALVGVAAIIASGAIIGTLVWVAMRPAPPRVSRLQVTPSGTAALTIGWNDRDLAITPDGSRLIYVGNQGTQIFVRALDALAPVAVFTGSAARAVRFPRWTVDRIRGRPRRVEESGGDRRAGGHAGDARHRWFQRRDVGTG